MTIKKLAVVGCGMMGRGIVEVAAAAGIPVIAIKATPGDLAIPQQAIEKSLARRVKKGKITSEQCAQILTLIEFTSDLEQVAYADLVIESAVEDEALKIDLLKRIEDCMDVTGVLCTNTSSLLLDNLSENLSRPEQFLGLHFFSPVPAMALVELGSIESTSKSTEQKAVDFCEQIGKTAVQVKSSAGYVVNRLLVPYILHAIETLESGITDAHGIDNAMKLGCAHPMGPLALADLIGLDVVHAMAVTLKKELGGNRYDMPGTLAQLFNAKQLGRKNGIGIYDYSGEVPVLNPDIILEPVCA